MHRMAVIQSNYIPWKGYFDLIRDVDLFVFYDDVQYTKGDWRNRNRVKTPRGVEWLTVPVGSDIRRRICEVEIRDRGWAARHWRKLQESYGSTPYFATYRPFLEHVYLGATWDRLSELNQYLVEGIARDLLGITTELADSRTFQPGGRRQERLLDLLTKLGTTEYVSGPAGRAYLDPALFRDHGIEVCWMDYAGYPEYDQLHGPFVHGVTVLDLLFHVGPAAPELIWGWRQAPLRLAASAAGALR